ncbi:hypothetical protein ACIQUB_22215 [Rhizobium sp. NPDC090275]|uniref:hypothetical protein n=1 Tax=Rhizobium sp. NPDC090275 TaxID=3364498 RepID=UPI00383B2550
MPDKPFWPGGARFVPSFSLMLEGGGQPISGAAGVTYNIDEPSLDEPFIGPLSKGDFVTVPYTFHMNDISSFPFEGWNPAAYGQALRDEFDQLYDEGAHRRRMMVVSLHDRTRIILGACACLIAFCRMSDPALACDLRARTRLPSTLPRQRD